MARPIKETPVLTGDDARAFEQVVKNNENKAASKEEFDEVKKAFSGITLDKSMSFR